MLLLNGAHRAGPSENGIASGDLTIIHVEYFIRRSFFRRPHCYFRSCVSCFIHTLLATTLFSFGKLIIKLEAQYYEPIKAPSRSLIFMNL